MYSVKKLYEAKLFVLNSVRTTERLQIKQKSNGQQRTNYFGVKSTLQL
jgi:hypothetical protein